LDDMQGMLPVLGASGKKNQTDTVAMGEPGTFHLPLEDDKLMTQQCILRQEIGAVAGQVKQAVSLSIENVAGLLQGLMNL